MFLVTRILAVSRTQSVQDMRPFRQDTGTPPGTRAPVDELGGVRICHTNVLSNDHIDLHTPLAAPRTMPYAQDELPSLGILAAVELIILIHHFLAGDCNRLYRPVSEECREFFL